MLMLLHALGSTPAAVDFHNVANVWHFYELVDKTLTVNFSQDASLVVISEKKEKLNK